jgi:hypothetical protein
VLRDLILEGGSQRTARDGQRDRDRDRRAVDLDVAHHVEVGDRPAQLRVDHLLERAEHLVPVDGHGKSLAGAVQPAGRVAWA